MSAPCILPFEVLNGLRYTYGLGERELEEVGKILEDFQFNLYGFENFIKDAVRLSSVYGITVYDASYVALGKILGQTVYTADEKLLKKVKELGFVVHIRDYRVT